MTQRTKTRELARKYLAGDSKASREIETYIDKAMIGWQNRLGYQTTEVISDVRYKLFISLSNKQFNFESTLKTYVNVIAKNTSLDFLRAKKRYEHIDIDDLDLRDNTKGADEKVVYREKVFFYFRAIRMVTAECRELWRMYIEKELNYREIGEIKGRSEEYIRRKSWECRKAAKKYLKKIENDANGPQKKTPKG